MMLACVNDVNCSTPPSTFFFFTLSLDFSMRIKLSLSYIFTFLLLLIVMMEMHELVHISVGRIICECWGPRDFNVWSLCKACANKSMGWLATLAGPVFSFTVMWLGMFWLTSPDAKKKAVGFAFIFTNIPFGRITTMMMGGGDEMVVVRNFLGNSFSRTQMILLGSALVLIVALPPIIKAFQVLTNKKSWLYVVGFLTLPLAFLLLYTLMGLNTLLDKGFLAAPWIMGTPLLITIHTVIAFLLLLWQWKNIYRFNSGHHGG